MKKSTDITIVLDRSGSMETIKKATITGFNSFISAQKEMGDNTKVSLVQFDHEYGVSYEAEDIKMVKKLTKNSFEPRGATALLDAIGMTIKNTKRRIKLLADEDKPEHVVIAIITDGEENSSDKYTRKEIFKMVAKRERKNGWEFVFIGSNQDAIAEGASFGIRTEKALTFANDDEGAVAAFESLAASMSIMKESKSASFSFRDEDRLMQERNN